MANMENAPRDENYPLAVRELSNNEQIIFNSLIAQGNMRDEPFIYDASVGHDYISKKEAYIDRDELIATIKRFSDDKLLYADWFTDSGIIDAPISSSEKTAYDASWSKWLLFEMSGLSLFPPKKYEDYFFIHIPPKQIKLLKEAIDFSYNAKISPDNDFLSLIVSITHEDKDHKYRIRALKDGYTPAKVIEYALKNIDREVDIAELAKKLNLSKKKNIKKIFERNKTITDTLSPIIVLKPNSILIKKEVTISKLQYNKITKDSKKID